MKKKLFLIIFLIVILSISLVLLTGCGNSKVEKNDTNSNENNIDNNRKQDNQVEPEESQNNEVENEVETEQITTKDPKQEIIDAWFKLPTNLDYYVTKEFSDGTSSVQHYSKRENDIMLSLENNYYFYKYTDNNIWTSYEYTNGKGWDSYYYKGCIITTPGSCEGMMLKKLDNYTAEHEKFNVEGVGEVDTVIGKDGDDIYYYSKDLDINVKVVTKNVTLIVNKFDKNVTDYPNSIPDNIE